MKLQKQKSRKTKDKVYNKWVINIPNKIIEDLNWKEGEEIESIVSEKKLLLSVSKSQISKKTKIKKIMDEKEKPSSYEKFMKIFPNLPILERTQVVVVIDNKEISWEVAHKEIKNRTELGREIEEKLSELDII